MKYADPVKGSNLLNPIRSKRAVAIQMMPNGVVKFKDVQTGVHFRSNDFQIIRYKACISWQEFMNIKVTKPRLSLPHARDIEIVQGDRNVNILEIGSNNSGND